MQQINITIHQGATFNYGFKLAESERIYKPITAITSRVPVQLTVENHQLPDQWPVIISCVKYPYELNTTYPVIATVVDENSLVLNDLTLCFKRPLSGNGVITYYKPYDLTDFKARAMIRPSVYSDEVFYQWDNLTIEPQNHLINLQIPAEITATFQWRNAVYDIDALTPSGEVIALINTSHVTVVPKVSR